MQGPEAVGPRRPSPQSRRSATRRADREGRRCRRRTHRSTQRVRTAGAGGSRSSERTRGVASSEAGRGEGSRESSRSQWGRWDEEAAPSDLQIICGLETCSKTQGGSDHGGAYQARDDRMRFGRQEECGVRARGRWEGLGADGGTEHEGGDDEVLRSSASARRCRGGRALAVGKRGAPLTRSRGDDRESAAGGADLAERQQERPNGRGALSSAGTFGPEPSISDEASERGGAGGVGGGQSSRCARRCPNPADQSRQGGDQIVRRSPAKLYERELPQKDGRRGARGAEICSGTAVR